MSGRDGWIAFGAVLLGAAAWGETYPFSRFSMYANVGTRDSGAVPVFLADGQLVQPRRYERFQGFEPEAVLRARSFPSSLGYVTDDGYRWIRDHRAPSGDAPGPARFAVAVVVVRLSRERGLERDVTILAEGRAWPR